MVYGPYYYSCSDPQYVAVKIRVQEGPYPRGTEISCIGLSLRIKAPFRVLTKVATSVRVPLVSKVDNSSYNMF